MRATKQRIAILNALDRARRPLSAPELLDHARREVPGIGLATVYRAIESLVTDARVTVVEIPGKPPRYELSGKDHHHHFLCAVCHKVFEVEGCPGNIDALVPRGFTLDKHELTLYGTCQTCTRNSTTHAPLTSPPAPVAKRTTRTDSSPKPKIDLKAPHNTAPKRSGTRSASRDR